MLKLCCKAFSLYLIQDILIFSYEVLFKEKDGTCQGLMQKEKVHIDCEKVAQINILSNKIVTMVFENYQGVQTNYTLHFFSIFSLLCSDYVADLIKSWNCV